MKRFSRVIAFAICLIMVVGMLPAGVFAAGGLSDIDFTSEADAGKYEIIGQTSAAVAADGLALVTTTSGIEPAGRNITQEPVDLVQIPVAGDWTATLECVFDTNGAANGYYQFFGFFAAADDDLANTNLVGIRGGDQAIQDFIRQDGTLTTDTDLKSAPGFDTSGKTYFLRIEKEGTTYNCYRSDDGEEFAPMFSYEDTGIDAEYLVIDAYTGMTTGYKYTLKYLAFEGDAGGEAAWTEADGVESDKAYVIVADGQYALSANADGAIVASAVTVDGDKITSEVTDGMVWTFADAEGAEAAIDGSDLYFIMSADEQYLRRDSSALALGDDSGEMRYRTWSLIAREAEDGAYTFFSNGNSSGAASRYAVSGAETGFTAARVSNSSGNIQTAGSSVRLYELVGGSTVQLDKKAIRAAIREAKSKDDRFFTAESFAVLTEALAAAETALAEATTQAALDAAAEALNAAIAGLVDNPDLPMMRVTFNYNYTGAPDPVVVEVKMGSTVEPIATNRVGYSATWRRGNQNFNFSTPITEDITLTASWSKDWNQMYSLAEEYRDYFAFGNFGTQSPNGDQVTREYNTYSGNSGKMTYNFGANESRNAYNNAVSQINADTSLTEEEKAQKIKEADGKVLLGGNNPLQSDLNRIQQWNQQHPEGPKKYYRQHVLCWHGSEQNAAFYHEGFDTSKPLASREVMNLRIDSYVEAMFKRYQPWDDIILSWDIVNEALDDYTGMVRNGWNGSSWGETTLDDASNQSSAWGTIYRMKDENGNPVKEMTDERLQYESEWIRQAFASARKWQQELGVHWTLYYNDYMNSSMLYEPKMTNTLKVLKPIYEAGNIDGYGMQARLAYAYPGIDLLRYQIEEGLKVADEVSFSEADVRTDFEVNPLFDPDKPTRRVQNGDEEWDQGGSGSYNRRSQQNGNTYDVSNGPVRRKNNFSASDPEAQRLQADYWADLVDIMLEKAEQGKVGAIAMDGTSDSNTFNRGTGCQVWDSSSNEKPAFFALIGAPNRLKMRHAIEDGPADSEESKYTAESWARYAAAKKAAEDLVEVRIYTGEGVEAVKAATAELLAATEALEEGSGPIETGALKLGPNVIKDPESPTGYTVKFLYDNATATSVTFNGDIMYRDDSNRSDTTNYSPFDYKPGYMRAAGFNAPMEKKTLEVEIDGAVEEKEVWYYEVPMSAGANQYWFTVNGGSRMEPDPANPPYWSPNSAANKDAYNTVYVPYDAKQDYEPTKARTAELPRTDGKSGVWDYYPIEFGGRTHYMGIYTPYGYDEKRAEPYKLIFMLHGMGQDESDWMGIGSVQKIMDNLVVAGKTEPAVIVSVTSNNNFLGSGGGMWGGGGANAYTNVSEYVIPYIEEHYNVSTDPMNRAWAGLSMGSSNTQGMINANAPLFGWYGCFSLGNSVTATNPDLAKTHILFGDGTADFGALSEAQITAVQTICDNGGFARFERVTGGHDFNTWCQLFRIWCEKYLWNPAAFGDGEPEEVDTAALDAAIADAAKIDKSEYTAESVAAFEEALAAAEAAKNSNKQSEVDAAAQALKDAIAALEKKPEIDKTALGEAIEAAEALKAEDYTEDSYKALIDAVEAAKAIQSKADATQAEVDAAAKAVTDAIAALEPKSIDIGHPALDKAIEDAEAIDAALYTEASAAALAEALAAAKAVQATQDATQAEVDKATDALNAAIAALEPKPDATFFEDVKDPGKFYYDAVYWAFNADPQITNGVDDTHFGPDNACTRGHVVTFLWRAAGEPEPKSTKTPFTDLKPGAFYEKAVAWAVEEGITKGMTDTTFAPDGKCNRGQIVTFLWRFKGEPAPKSTKTPFTDLKPGAFYENAVAWAVENDVTKGMTETTFGPDATCTRGQVVTFLYRATAE